MIYYICPSKNEDNYVVFDDVKSKVFEIPKVSYLKYKLLGDIESSFGGNIDFTTSKGIDSLFITLTLYNNEFNFVLERDTSAYLMVGDYCMPSYKFTGRYECTCKVNLPNNDCCEALKNYADFGNLNFTPCVHRKSDICRIAVDLYFELFDSSYTQHVKIGYNCISNKFFVSENGVVDKCYCKLKAIT